MQKLWLKNFEFQINPITWNAAQDLTQAGAVRALRELESHFWVARVTDGEVSYEVEMMITPHKIKAFTCECWSEGRRLMCAHIAASLLKIRQFLEKKASERQARNAALSAEETASRLTVPAVLADVPAEALAEFVREYARRDRDFALALKTWFAGALNSPQNAFALVLESALPRNNTVKTLREVDFRRLRKTLEDLIDQLNTAEAEANYRHVFLIGTAVLEKITPFWDKAEDPRRSQLSRFCQLALSKIVAMPAAELSPELRNAVWDAIFALLGKNLLPPELIRPAVGYLCAAAADEDQFARIQQLFDNTPFPAPAGILHLFLAALARRNRPESIVRVLEDYLENPALLKDAIVFLHYAQHTEAVLAAGEYFLAKAAFTAGPRREIEDLLLLHVEKTGDQTRLLHYLRQRYRQNSHPDLYQRLKKTAGAEWPSVRAALLADMRQAGEMDRIATLLAAEHEWQVLMGLLESSGDMALFQRFEHQLDPNFVRMHYLNLLTEYLRQHFGKPAAAFVREALGSLLRRGESALALRIVQELILRFADRPSLPEELAEMFPQNQRKQLFSSETT